MKASIVINIGKGLLLFALGLVFVWNFIVALAAILPKPEDEAVAWLFLSGLAALITLSLGGASFAAARQEDRPDLPPDATPSP